MRSAPEIPKASRCSHCSILILNPGCSLNSRGRRPKYMRCLDVRIVEVLVTTLGTQATLGIPRHVPANGNVVRPAVNCSRIIVGRLVNITVEMPGLSLHWQYILGLAFTRKNRVCFQDCLIPGMIQRAPSRESLA